MAICKDRDLEMDLNINLWATLALFGVAQGMFLSLVLFLHCRGNRFANRILATLIFLFSLRV